ncbi:MAG TPA: arsenate reductase ArsC [Candidatus Acidoferrales bacterium]|nr:arsenate reductase ArsC [Candidatus Acidoferrales bacterium]
MPKSVLFLCTHNSARSQMAEGLARALAREHGSDVEVWSAGTEARAMHPLAVKAMAEIRIDISRQRSKTLAEAPPNPDYAITLCSQAAEACPVFPTSAKSLHWDLPDPSAAEGSEEDRLAAFRMVRDLIARRLDEFWRKEMAGAAPDR